LIYYEATNDIEAAIRREKQIKSWVRRRKVALTRVNESGVEGLERGLVLRVIAEILRSVTGAARRSPTAVGSTGYSVIGGSE